MVDAQAMLRTAKLSECGTYRYQLTRQWGPDIAKWVCFIGLNPSTADALKDDQTIRKLIGFTERWGYEGFRIVNLYAFRSRHPKVMRVAADPIGPLNEQWLVRTATESRLVVACWGNHITARARGPFVLQTLRAVGVRPKCFGKTMDGHPKHPLTLAYSTELVDL